MSNLADVSGVMYSETSIGITISRDSFTFSAAHFCQLSDNSSERLHGHNYSVGIEVAAKPDPYGFVVDFALLKRLVHKVSGELNHRVLIPSRSPRLLTKVTLDEVDVRVDGKHYVFPASDVVLVPVKNTTCEELSLYILNIISEDLPNVSLKIQVMEAPNQGAFSNLDRCYE